MDEAIKIIKAAMPYIQQIHDEAESKHDTYGEYYMDSVQYEIMENTESLLTRMQNYLKEIT